MGDNGTFKIADFEEELKENKVNSNDKKDSDIVKVSLSFNVEDWLDLVRFKNHKVVELKSLDYTISDAFLYGLTLLEKKHKIERNREKVSLKRGRRNNEKPELKGTTIDIANERAGFMNDFLYFRVFDKGNLEYTRPEMMNEVVHLIKQNNKEIFKS